MQKWTLEALKERLENQLIGQYLRPANVCFGIYVLGNVRPKRRWKIPGSKEEVNFSKLVELIQGHAKNLQLQSAGKVEGIAVIGIDFSDPRER